MCDESSYLSEKGLNNIDFHPKAERIISECFEIKRKIRAGNKKLYSLNLLLFVVTSPKLAVKASPEEKTRIVSINQNFNP